MCRPRAHSSGLETAPLDRGVDGWFSGSRIGWCGRLVPGRCEDHPPIGIPPLKKRGWPSSAFHLSPVPDGPRQFVPRRLPRHASAHRRRPPEPRIRHEKIPLTPLTLREASVRPIPFAASIHPHTLTPSHPHTLTPVHPFTSERREVPLVAQTAPRTAPLWCGCTILFTPATEPRTRYVVATESDADSRICGPIPAVTPPHSHQRDVQRTGRETLPAHGRRAL